jgi:hypothetical protein
MTAWKDERKKAAARKRTIPKMPEGYYSGDKPNPNLRAFVQKHLAERPYDPETDKYDVPAFDHAIETTKATAIYNMHTYWSKKPHDAIRQYIRHYTKPGVSRPRSLLRLRRDGSGSTHGGAQGHCHRSLACGYLHHQELLHASRCG